MGPTSSGKTYLAERLADQLDATLVNADAFQVYRGFDIGTAKPVRRDRYELIDILEPTSSFGVGEFVQRASEILDESFRQTRNAIVVGGTGLYVRALFEEYADLAEAPDPATRAHLEARWKAEGLAALANELASADPIAAARTDLANPRRVLRALERIRTGHRRIVVRIPYTRRRKVAVLPDHDRLAASIRSRLDAMMQGGFADEVRRRIADGVPEEAPAMNAIGYRTIARMLEGTITREEAFESIVAETGRYAKRQRTWLRTEPSLDVLPGRFGHEAVDDALRLLFGN